MHLKKIKRGDLFSPLLFLIGFVFSFPAFAVKDSSAYGDTLYYRKYKDRFIAGYYISTRSYNVKVEQRFNKDTTGFSVVDYFAEANTVSGFSFQYDIFAISFGFKSAIKPEDKKLKGTTRYTDFGITSFGNKIAFDAKYKNYLGFYDKRLGGNFDTITKSFAPYYQNSSMDVRSFKGKFYYFFNHKKFSFHSAYANAQQQIKSVGSWFLISNIYHLRLKTDTSFIPLRGRGYYNHYANINHLGVAAASFGAGGSRNFVWKNFFINLTLGFGLEMQFLKYGYNTGDEFRKKTQIAGALETRSAIGYNGKNFYLSISGFNDYSLFTDAFHQLNANYYNGQFNIGYRFKVKKPALMDKIQATKLYQMF